MKSSHLLRRIAFGKINEAALARLSNLLACWLPGGVLRGAEYVVCNPRRADEKRGSFKVNTRTGRWADWATDDRGGDPISLAAYLAGTRQSEAALNVANQLGIDPYDR